MRVSHRQIEIAFSLKWYLSTFFLFIPYIFGSLNWFFPSALIFIRVLYIHTYIYWIHCCCADLEYKKTRWMIVVELRTNGCAIVICANSVKLDLIVKCGKASEMRAHIHTVVTSNKNTKLHRWRRHQPKKKRYGKSFIKQWRSCVAVLLTQLKPDSRHSNSPLWNSPPVPAHILPINRSFFRPTLSLSFS